MLTFSLLGSTIMLHSHQAKANFSLMFGVNSCTENNVTKLFAMSLSHSLGVNEPLVQRQLVRRISSPV